MIQEHRINYDLAKRDQEAFHNYLKQTRQAHHINDKFKNINEKLISDTIFEIKGFPYVGFYSLEDAERIINFINKSNFKKVRKKDGTFTKRMKEYIFDFIKKERIETVDFFTFNDLLYHSQGNWVKNISY